MASFPLECTLTTQFSKFRQCPKSGSNPTSKWFSLHSNTRTNNKPSHLNGFRVFAAWNHNPHRFRHLTRIREAREKERAEEAKRKEAEEAKRKEIAEAKTKEIAEEAKRKEAEEAKKKEIAEATKKNELVAEAKREEAEEAKRKEAEEVKKKEIAEATKKNELAEEAKRKEAEEAKRKEAEEVKKKEIAEATKKNELAEEAKRKEAEEAKRKEAEEVKKKEIAEATKKNELAEEAKRKEAEEAKRKEAEEVKKKEIAEATKKNELAEEAKRKEAEEAKRKEAEEVKKKEIAEATKKSELAEKAKKKEAEEAKKKEIAEEVKRNEIVAEAKRKEAEEAKKKEIAEEAKKKNIIEEAKRKEAEETKKEEAKEAKKNEVTEETKKKEARENRDEEWKKALKVISTQIDSIRRKIETHFMDTPYEAFPMLKILDDVKSLVDIHNANVGLKQHIPTTDAAMKVAHHFQAYKQSKREDGLIPVDKVKPKKHILSPMIDMFTEVANLLYGQRGDEHFLKGNFAPIREETPPTKIEVEGTLPSCIRGMFIRNGPNPQFDPVGKYGWLDGDGMLHATYFKDGKVTYASRYTKTSRFRQEQITGQAEFPKYGDFTGAFGVFSAFAQLLKSVFVLDASYGHGVANENIMYHDGMLLALEDFDRPYAIKIKKDGDLETLGVYDFKKKLSHDITPHTKKDPITGEWFVFGASYTKPYMTYRVVAKDGSISEPRPIDDIEGPTYMHDFGITENYVIIMDLSFTFSPEAMVKHNDWIYNVNPLKKPRIGIRSRNQKIDDKITWFEFDVDKPFFIYHNANSWEEEDGKVVLCGCRIGSQKGPNDPIPIIKSVQLSHAFSGENHTTSLPEMYKYTFDLKSGTVEEKRIGNVKVDYPKINEKHMGRKSQYLYACEFLDEPVGDIGKISSIVKFDLDAVDPEKQVRKLTFGENRFGSEVAFVQSDIPTTEDDGYLINYVHDEATGESYVYVSCAKEMKKVAQLKLPKRIPYGFHSTFVDEYDIASQRNSDVLSEKIQERGLQIKITKNYGEKLNLLSVENEN